MKLEELLNAYYSMKPLSNDAIKNYYEAEITEHVYESNAIEGSTLTLHETDLIINKGITVSGKSIAEVDEAIGTKKAFLFILENLRNELSENTVCKINGLIRFKYPAEASYRSENVRIMGSRVILPDSSVVPGLMKNFVVDYNKEFTKINLKENFNDIHNFIKLLSSYHLRFETIHPFIDGNGRTGRLLLNIECIKQGLPPINIKYDNKVDYYGAFKEFDSTNNTSSMEKVIYDALESSITTYLNHFNR